MQPILCSVYFNFESSSCISIVGCHRGGVARITSIWRLPLVHNTRYDRHCGEQKGETSLLSDRSGDQIRLTNPTGATPLLKTKPHLWNWTFRLVRRQMVLYHTVQRYQQSRWGSTFSGEIIYLLKSTNQHSFVHILFKGMLTCLAII